MLTICSARSALPMAALMAAFSARRLSEAMRPAGLSDPRLMETPVERRSSVWVIIDCCWPSTRRASMEETLVLMLDMIAPKENAPIPSGVLNGRGFLPSKFDSAPRTPPGMTRTHRVGWSFYRSNWEASSILDRLFRTFAVIGLFLARSLHQAFRLETPAGAILSWGDCSPAN